MLLKLGCAFAMAAGCAWLLIDNPNDQWWRGLIALPYTYAWFQLFPNGVFGA